ARHGSGTASRLPAICTGAQGAATAGRAASDTATVTSAATHRIVRMFAYVGSHGRRPCFKKNRTPHGAKCIFRIGPVGPLTFLEDSMRVPRIEHAVSCAGRGGHWPVRPSCSPPLFFLKRCAGPREELTMAKTFEEMERPLPDTRAIRLGANAPPSGG